MHPMFVRALNMNPWSAQPTRGTVARHFYGSQIPFGCPDSPYKVGLSGLGDIQTPNGVNWTNADANNDFVMGADTARGSYGRWAGVGQSVVNAFNEQQANAVGPKAQLVLSDFQQRAQPIADNISKNLQPFGIGGRSASQDTQYYAAMSQLKTLVLQYTVKLAQANADDSVAPSPKPSGSTSSGSTGASAGGGSALVAGSAAKGSFMQYLPMGLAVVALGVVGYVFLKK